MNPTLIVAYWQPEITTVNRLVRDEYLPIFYQTKELHFTSMAYNVCNDGQLFEGCDRYDYMRQLQYWNRWLLSSHPLHLAKIERLRVKFYFDGLSSAISPCARDELMTKTCSTYFKCKADQGDNRVEVYLPSYWQGKHMWEFTAASWEYIDDKITGRLASTLSQRWDGNDLLAIADVIWKAMPRLVCVRNFPVDYTRGATVPRRIVYTMQEEGAKMSRIACRSKFHNVSSRNENGDCVCQ